MSSKPTVTVGISAYNEEHAFPALLKLLLSQNQSTFVLEKIIVISDGSTDNTIKNLQAYTDNKIVVKEHTQRAGKAKRLNEICRLSISQILVLLDADISINDTHLLDKLIHPFRKDASLQGVSGNIQPNKPGNFVQHIIYAGTKLWDQTRENVSPNEVYYCTGAIRALRKSFYKTITFPDIAAEDVYPYLYAAANNLKFSIVSDAIVYYNLPSTYPDFLKQMKRYLTSQTTHEHIFDKQFIKNIYTITPKSKILTLIKQLALNPFWTMLYILFLIPAHLMSNSSTNKSTWDTAISSKTKGNSYD